MEQSEDQARPSTERAAISALIASRISSSHGAGMPIRTFRDDGGRIWRVWTVEPKYVERRFTEPPEDDPPVIERRKCDEVRIKIGEQWVNGWLAFETEGEKRRLAQFPDDWDRYSERELAKLCERAYPVSAGPRAAQFNLRWLAGVSFMDGER